MLLKLTCRAMLGGVEKKTGQIVIEQDRNRLAFLPILSLDSSYLGCH